MTPSAADLLGSADRGSDLMVGTAAQSPVLLLGLGNVLLEDEGLGIHALNMLRQRYAFPPEIEFLDGGTSGMALIDKISGRERLLVLDAVQTGDPPGTLVKLSDQDVPVYFGLKVTFHQLGLADVLASLELSGERPGHVTVIGLVPNSLELSLDLSDPISSRLDDLIEAVVGELVELGYPVRPKV